jgi:hypothetical protein
MGKIDGHIVVVVCSAVGAREYVFEVLHEAKVVFFLQEGGFYGVGKGHGV